MQAETETEKTKTKTMWLLTLMAVTMLTTPAPVQAIAQTGHVTHLQGVLGRRVDLPCDTSSDVSNDRAKLIIWYKNNETTPTFSWDGRQRDFGRPGQSGAPVDPPVTSGQLPLRLESVTADDEGTYRCRVDFQLSPTRNQRTHLSVIVPPGEPVISWEGRPVSGPLGPLQLGRPLTLVCTSRGGRPRPQLTWMRNGRPLSAEVSSGPGSGQVTSVLQMAGLTRDDLHARLQCSAANSNVTQAATAEVLIELTFPPLSVKILGSHLTPLTAQWNYSLVCRSQGSRPAANISWWLDGERLRNPAETVTKDGSVTTSTLPFRPETRDHGRQLVCRAENNHVTPAALETQRLLDVRYPPTVKISLGKALDPDSIREGTDVYFDCSISANPAAYTVSWLHDGVSMTPSQRPGYGDQVTINARSLVIRNLTRSAAGSYSCAAVNPEGSGASRPVQLSVKYAPVCSPGQRLQYAVTLHETTRVSCQVEAVPSEVTYRWQFNSSLETLDLPFSLSSAHGLSSTVSYTPTTELDYGQLLCTAENAIGRAAAPCVFEIVLAGPPAAPANCSLLNHTSESLLVACAGGSPAETSGGGSGGGGGGGERLYVAELYAVPDGRLLQNVTSAVPSFVLDRLPPGLELRLELYAVNRHGRSAAVLLDGFTLKAAEKRMRADTEPRNEGTVALTPVVACLAGAAVSLALVTAGAVICTKNSRRRSPQTVADRSSDEEALQKKKRRGGFEHSPDDPEAETARVLTICQLEDINPDVVPSRPDHSQACYESSHLLNHISTEAPNSFIPERSIAAANRKHSHPGGGAAASDGSRRSERRRAAAADRTGWDGPGSPLQPGSGGGGGGGGGGSGGSGVYLNTALLSSHQESVV